MKNFLYAIIGLCLVSKAHALDFECGKTIEVLPVPNSEGVSRPLLVYKTTTRPDGTILKQYKPLAASTEAVADFLLGIQGSARVCIKYYNPFLPAPVPLNILDIYLDK